MIKTAQDAYLAGRQAAMEKLASEKEARWLKPHERPPLKDSAIFAGKVGGGLGLTGLGLYTNFKGLEKAFGGARPSIRGLPLMAAGAFGIAAGRSLLGSTRPPKARSWWGFKRR
tara:strand:+ start:54 stop:395 length:342 start_codon:yes stop_codon:yes gene_type:complete